MAGTVPTTLNSNAEGESQNVKYCAYLREQKELTQSNLEATVQRLDDGEEDLFEVIEGIESQLASIDAQLSSDCGGGENIDATGPSLEGGAGPQSMPFIWKNDNPLEKPISFHRSLMGANLDIVQALDIIEFEKDKLSDAGMRGSIAYIRRWRRSGTARQTQIDTSESVSFPTDTDQLEGIVQTSWNQPINANLPEFARTTTINPFDPTIEYDAGIDFNTENINTSFNTENVDTSLQIADPKDYSFVPLNSFKEPTPSSSVQGTAAPTTSPIPATRGSSSAGKVISANPGGSGFGGFLTRLTSNILNIPSQPPLYSGKGGPSNAKTGTLEEGVWQFLFNPSELQLRAGPDYNKAQTWGVSEKENSGQPLSWRGNKNAELKFNNVLLNGYVFGRRVEELEQGIFDLFMARDGGGQDGPDVLEFVWGQKVFGPCVIKDIEVTEKAWDGGLVVNAEVSFTLEQVPEWVVNDGEVSVYNPSQLPLADQTPLTPASTTGTVGAGTTSPPSGDGTPDQNSEGTNPSTPNGGYTDLYKKCLRALNEYSSNFFKIQQRSSISSSKRTAEKELSKYNVLYASAVNELGSSFTDNITDPNISPTKLTQSVDISIQAVPKQAFSGESYKQANQMVSNAAKKAKAAIDKFGKSTTCKSEIEKADKLTKAQGAKRICKNKQPGGRCSWFKLNPGERTTTCNGQALICGADGFLKNPSKI